MKIAQSELEMSIRIFSHCRTAFRLASAMLLSWIMVEARAEEGFWLFSQAPVEEIASKYGVRLKPEWLDHLQKATVRFNSKRFDVYIGGSGSFVSADGLVLTNRHVIPRHVFALLDAPDRNIGRDGYVAHRTEEELKIPGLSLDAVVSGADVTERVVARVPVSAVGGDAERMRREMIAEIERGASSAPGTSAEVVALDAGARYILYVHRRYLDIRLVFAPEAAAAQRPDDHPAPAFDVALVRAYENDVPAHPQHFLRLSARTPAEGEPIFVGGAPTRSNRRVTVPELEAQRHVDLPHWVKAYARLHSRLAAFAAPGGEQARAVERLIAKTAFMRMIAEDRLASFQDERFYSARVAAERRVRDALAERNDAASLAAFETLDELWSERREDMFRGELLGLRGPPPWQKYVADLPFGLEFAPTLYSYGKTFLTLRRQRELPEESRMAGYREKDRADLESWLLDPEPVDLGIEAAHLASFFESVVEALGAEHPIARAALGGASPERRATELIRGTRLGDREFRRALYALDRADFDATSDPLLAALRDMEREESAIGEALRASESLLRSEGARARRAAASVAKDAAYPDATRTIRFGFGVVEGWSRGGATVPAFTPIGAYFARSDRDGSGETTPPRWSRHGERLDSAVTLDFVSTADVVAGHSGSATVDAEGRLVGVVFGPGATEGATASDCAYDAGKPRRAAHVAAAAVVEALASVYDAPHLVRELLRGDR
ncbi:MAG: hypothetical protein C3F11_09855 [Methylocystaceae bacterium]|nr:MAG: hypothetical protein C3F11_09855 [Methylocystaceae bacterium]